LISFVHPQKLSVPLRCSRRVVLRLVSFRERSSFVLHANICKYFRAKTPGVNSLRNANTCATNQCLPRVAPQKPLARIHLLASISGNAAFYEVFCFIYRFLDVLEYAMLKETRGNSWNQSISQRRIFKLQYYTEKKDWLLQQIISSKIWHSIFKWLQQPIFGCVSLSAMSV